MRPMDGFPCFILMIIVAAMIGAAWFSRARSRDVDQAFTSVARWYRGRFLKSGWLSFPVMHIPYGNGQFQVSITKTAGGRKCTEARIPWAANDAVVRIRSNQVGVRPWTSGHSLMLGNGDWDRQFAIETNDDAAARQLVIGGVQSAVIMLSRIRKTGGIDITIGHGQFVVQKLAVLDQSAELSAFVRHVLELYDQALLSRSVGIEFVDHQQMQMLEDAKCPVCGDGIDDGLVFCSRCQTPHHRDCWNYCGKCATYGCGEVNFVYPRIAKPR
jgi:hypothetical protein